MRTIPLIVLAMLALACGDDDENEANRLGVGASCERDDMCAVGQRCLTEFKAGYCGVAGCAGDTDCPEGSACVIHGGGAADGGVNGGNYCFLICNDKPQCNLHRAPEDEANCSSSIDFTDEENAFKACVPPSGS